MNTALIDTYRNHVSRYASALNIRVQTGGDGAVQIWTYGYLNNKRASQVDGDMLRLAVHPTPDPTTVRFETPNNEWEVTEYNYRTIDTATPHLWRETIIVLDEWARDLLKAPLPDELAAQVRLYIEHEKNAYLAVFDDRRGDYWEFLFEPYYLYRAPWDSLVEWANWIALELASPNPTPITESRESLLDYCTRHTPPTVGRPWKLTAEILGDMAESGAWDGFVSPNIAPRQLPELLVSASVSTVGNIALGARRQVFEVCDQLATGDNVSQLFLAQEAVRYVQDRHGLGLVDLTRYWLTALIEGNHCHFDGAGELCNGPRLAAAQHAENIMGGPVKVRPIKWETVLRHGDDGDEEFGGAFLSDEVGGC